MTTTDFKGPTEGLKGPKAHQEVKIPSYVGQSLTSLLVFIMGATMRGILQAIKSANIVQGVKKHS
jgi:hypothetical protein